MNILPHKSWHVRTKQNISRVRRDEEKAKKEEEEKQKRINLAEHEARIALLKSKKGISTQPSTSTNEETFNLFDNFKDKLVNDNEREIDKKVEQEKWEVKTGIFSYLDGRYKYQNEKDEQWYLKSHDERFSSTCKDDTESLKEKKSKLSHDPLLDIKRYLSEMEKCSPKVELSKREVFLGNAITHWNNDIDSSVVKKKKKKSKDKKNKRHKHRSRLENKSETSSDESNNSLNKEVLIQKLRNERLERERKERIRSRQLIQGTSPSTETVITSHQPSQKYNSQFNPHIARQNCVND